MKIENSIDESLTKDELLCLLKKQNKILDSLQKIDTRYQNLLENSNEGIYKSTKEGRFIEVNKGLVDMLGYDSKEELLSIDIKSQLYYDINDRVKSLNIKSSDERLVCRMLKKDGSVIWVENYGSTINNFDGNMEIIEGFVRDISEVKKANIIQKVLLNISQVGYETSSLKDFNKFVMTELGKLIDTSNFYIAFYDEDKQTINIPFISGEEADEEFPIGKSMTGYLIKKSKPLLVKSKEYKRLIDDGIVDLIGTFPKVWLGVPLIISGKVIGAIVVQSYDNESAYNQKDIELLEFVSSFISTAIKGSRRTLELKKFMVAVEQSANTIVITDTNGNIEYVNLQFTESTGYTKQEVLGINPRVLSSGKQSKEYYTKMWKAISSGKEWLGEFQNKAKNGRLYWERVAITPIKNDEGVILNYMAIKEDITTQKSTEEKLRKATKEAVIAKEVLRKVLDNIPIKVFWKDIDSKFLGCNNAYLKEKRLNKETDVIDKTDFDFHKLEDAKKYRADEVAIMLSGKPKLNYQESSLRTGKERWFKANKLPFFDDNKKVIGIICTSEDITELRENEINLKKATDIAIAANLSKSTFLSNMSHEIRTPMNAILGYSQLLQEDNNLTKVQQENLKTINKSGEHLLALIDDILDMSKIEAGRITLSYSDFNFVQLLKEVEHLFEFKSTQKNLELEFIKLNELPKIINGDESKIRQVIINLVGNAIKFTSEGFVHVLIENKGNNTIKVCVKDSGNGVLKEEQESIFKPFEQAQKGERVTGGTGLGLAISKKFSNLMGGDITLKSEYGKGSEFVFEFKFNETEENILIENNRGLKITSLIPEMKGYKIAIVDDRFENRDILYKKLNPLGFETRMAENGLEAVELYKEWKPDIVLMDVVMPVMDGVEATRQILELSGDHDVKVFVVSASALESEQKEVMEIGATVFIKKPVIFASLLSEMHQKGGIQFVYEDENIEEKVTVGPSDVPTSLKEKLLIAASEGDFLLLQELLINVEKETKKSFEYLENCINEMEFEELINWFKT